MAGDGGRRPNSKHSPDQPQHPSTNTFNKPQQQVLQNDGSAPKAASSGGGAAKAAAPAKKRAPEVSEQTGGVSAQTIALPGALAVIAGGTFAISKVDEGFFEFLEATSAKDNTLGADGVGYETALKGEGGLSAPKGAAGTKKVKAKAAGGGLFGKK
jgi:hypothetical protein